MKIIILLVVVILGATVNANCNEISASIEKTSYFTVITCSPLIDEVIEKAYFSLYTSDNQPFSFSNRKMNVSYDNKASYILRGPHDIIEGKCKFVLAGGNIILREDFLASLE